MQKLNYQEILQAVKTKHDTFLGKYSPLMEKTFSEGKMSIDLTYARISFIAKILQDAKVIFDYKESDVMVEGTLFPRSIALLSRYGTNPVYVLNSGKDIFVYEGVALDHPGNLSFLVWSRNEQTKKFDNVLDDGFDWLDFSMCVTEAIQKSSYRRKEMIENIISN